MPDILNVDAKTTVEMVPLDRMLVNAVDSFVFLGGREVPHGKEGKGYQRNPYDASRVSWFEANVFAASAHEEVKNAFSTTRARPIEGCLLEDGPYKGMVEIVDGGGTWMCHEREGKPAALVRVHRKCDLMARAGLFHHFDTVRLRLRNWQLFHAQLIEGDPTTVEIANEIRPLYVAGKGEGALQNVGSLYQVLTHGAPRALSRTAKALANTEGWGKTASGTLSRRIDPINFLAIALVYDGGAADADVREAMGKYTFKVPNGGPRLKGSKALTAAIETAVATNGKVKYTSAMKALTGANILAKKIGLRGDLSESDLFAALQRRSGTTARTSSVRPKRPNPDDLHIS